MINSKENALVASEKCVSCWRVPGVTCRFLGTMNLSYKTSASVLPVYLLNYDSLVVTDGSASTLSAWIDVEMIIAILVRWQDYSSSIGRFSFIISCRNSSRVDVEEWESSSWTCCTLSGWHIHLVRGVRKSACTDSRSLIFLDIFPKLSWKEGINCVILI